MILTSAATVTLLALSDAAQPQASGMTLGPAAIRLADTEFSPQAPPGLTGGFAADDDDQAQLQQQLQQSMQQAQEQNDQAEQQFNQDMQQQQTYENQFNNP
ncbi:hypothetical protein A5686_25915 [Mycobacterium sp. E2479]|nr:hypothetical protein A5686_25915 [Mycobacterium sp. E2479]